jgi:L-alanine-DL-glutamate epimerase-like enolase superfamily enzyme
MKIRKLETFCNEFVGFVRATSDSGHEGWGQVSTYNADITCEIFHRQVARHAMGRPAIDFGDTLDLIGEREHKYPGSYLRRAMAGLDTALWDLRGKLEGKPVATLLGGSPGKLRAYASSMKRDITPEDEARRFLKLRDDFGFDAFKWRVGAECGRDQDEWPGRTEAVIPVVARALGDGIDKLVDGNSCYSPKRAIEVGRMLEAEGIGHFEEPCPYWEFAQTKEVKEALAIDVAGGEQDCEFTVWARRDVHGRHDAHHGGGAPRRGGGHPVHAARRQPLARYHVHNALAARHSQCRQVSRVLHRGARLLPLARRPFPW